MLDQHIIRHEFQQITKAVDLGEDWVPREPGHTFVSIKSAGGVPIAENRRTTGLSAELNMPAGLRTLFTPLPVGGGVTRPHGHLALLSAEEVAAARVNGLVDEAWARMSAGRILEPGVRGSTGARCARKKLGAWPPLNHSAQPGHDPAPRAASRLTVVPRHRGTRR
jgi:hypothetical protein